MTGSVTAVSCWALGTRRMGVCTDVGARQRQREGGKDE